LWYCIVYTEILPINIAGPDKTSTRLAIERSCSAMADSKNVCILGGRVSYLGKGRDAIAARELKDVCGVLDDYI